MRVQGNDGTNPRTVPTDVDHLQTQPDVRNLSLQVSVGLRAKAVGETVLPNDGPWTETD